MLSYWEANLKMLNAKLSATKIIEHAFTQRLKQIRLCDVMHFILIHSIWSCFKNQGYFR